MNTQAQANSSIRPGQRIECVTMLGVPHRQGTRGTVTKVMGSLDETVVEVVFVAWDDGTESSLVQQLDTWKVLSEK